ncbi:MAG: helix-turn-helix transcriptional regulator, partial [Stackebrandtia sp.]
LGIAYHQEGLPGDARATLRKGLDLAQECGGVALARRAHAALIAAGARPRRVRQSGVAALTPTEQRIARLVAEGRTNRDIAQSLFVTPRTVELHLTAVYRKLRISGRAELAHALR